MPRTQALSFRIEPELKQGLERAAMADRRSVSSLVEKILTEWLQSQSPTRRAKSASSNPGSLSKPAPRARQARAKAQMRALRERR